MINKSQKQDTSTLVKTRHFYFGLTRKILTIDICNGLAYNNFGCIYMKTGRYEEAKSIIETGLRIDPASDLLKKNYRAAMILLSGGKI